MDDNNDADMNGYDLDDEEVRRRLLKMKAVDALVAREQDESDAGLMKRTQQRFAHAKEVAQKGALADRNANVWFGKLLYNFNILYIIYMCMFI